MKQKQYILFDLDGTITDPGLGITNSIMHALRRLGIAVPEREELYRFIGPPLWDSFQKYYGISKEESNVAVEYFREYYRDRGIYECKVYEGMRELLETLKAEGRTLIVATSKAEFFARQVLGHFGLAAYFDFIAGSELDGTRSEKAEVIAYALENCGITDKSRAVMIGDREHDIIGAKKNGIESIGVLHGYGSREELEAAGAGYIADNIIKLAELLIGENDV